MATSSNDPRTTQPLPESPGHLRPGDEAPPGTPGSAESTCRQCDGSGTLNGKPCPVCEGTGYVNVEIGGA